MEKEKKQTSRNWIIDGVELIGQLLALNSHLQEIVNSYGKSDKVSEDDYEFAELSIKLNNKTRRDIMTKIQSSVEKTDDKRWCALKHSIFAYELSCELLYANPEDETLKETQGFCSEQMYSILSRFMLKEAVLCGRCLDDQLI